MAFKLVEKRSKLRIETGAVLNPTGHFTVSLAVMKELGNPKFITFMTDRKGRKLGLIASTPQDYSAYSMSPQKRRKGDICSYKANIRAVASQLSLTKKIRLENFHWNGEEDMYIGEYK